MPVFSTDTGSCSLSPSSLTDKTSPIGVGFGRAWKGIFQLGSLGGSGFRLVQTPDSAGGLGWKAEKRHKHWKTSDYMLCLEEVGAQYMGRNCAFHEVQITFLTCTNE